MADLKPCPFCGGSVKLLEADTRIMCRRCGAVVKFLDRSAQPWRTHRAQETAEAWNRRAGS